jgi:hypothetical protein
VGGILAGEGCLIGVSPASGLGENEWRDDRMLKLALSLSFRSSLECSASPGSRWPLPGSLRCSSLSFSSPLWSCLCSGLWWARPSSRAVASGAPGLAQWRSISALLNVRPARPPGESGDPLNNLPLRPQRSAYGPEPRPSPMRGARPIIMNWRRCPSWISRIHGHCSSAIGGGRQSTLTTLLVGATPRSRHRPFVCAAILADRSGGRCDAFPVKAPLRNAGRCGSSSTFCLQAHELKCRPPQ